MNNDILDGERIELCAFIAVFILCTVYVIPGKNFFFKYDVKHFYKYKYIVNVIYDLVGIILIPSGLNVINNKWIDEFSLFLFGICIVIFIIVSCIRYFIEKTYDELKNNYYDEDKDFLSYNSRPIAQIIVHLYIMYLLFLPANFIYNFFLNHYSKNWIIITFLYLIWVVVAIKLVQAKIIYKFGNAYVDKVRRKFIYKIMACCSSLIINTLYALSLNIKIQSLWFLLINAIIAGITIFFIQLTFSLRFNIYTIGNYKEIQNDIYVVDKNVKMNFSVSINKNKAGNFKLVGILPYRALLVLRLKSNRIEYFKNIDQNACIKDSSTWEKFYEFDFYIRKIFNELKYNEVQYVVFLNENGELVYQPLIKMESKN